MTKTSNPKLARQKRKYRLLFSTDNSYSHLKARCDVTDVPTDQSELGPALPEVEHFGWFDTRRSDRGEEGKMSQDVLRTVPGSAAPWRCVEIVATIWWVWRAAATVSFQRVPLRPSELLSRLTNLVEQPRIPLAAIDKQHSRRDGGHVRFSSWTFPAFECCFIFL